MTSTLASKFHHAHSFLVSVSYHDQSLWLTRSRETVMQRPQEARNFCRFFFSWCAKISLRKTKFSQKNFLHWRNYTYKHYMKNLGAIYFKFLFRSETKLEGYKSSAGKIKTTNSKWKFADFKNRARPWSAMHTEKARKCRHLFWEVHMCFYKEDMARWETLV